MINYFQNYIKKIDEVFFLFGLDTQDESRIVFAEVLENTLLKSHFNYFVQHPTFFSGQTNDFIKSDLVATGIVDNMFII